MFTSSCVQGSRTAQFRQALEDQNHNFITESFDKKIDFSQNAEIYGDEEVADHFYQVSAGAVRTHKILEDGRRQIADFYFPGDFFGLEFNGHYKFTAEAVCNTTVSILRRKHNCERDREGSNLAQLLLSTTHRQLERSEKHTLLLILTAQERLAAFLIEMLERIGKQKICQLPMNRQDIADYLGMTIETLSRTITLFETDGTISLSKTRCFVIRNHQALRMLIS